jgi:hypothetical protein
MHLIIQIKLYIYYNNIKEINISINVFSIAIYCYIIGQMRRNIILTLFLLSISVQGQAQAQWNVVSHTDTDSGFQTDIATIENNDGYKLEIYRDVNDVVRLRFNIRNSFELLARKQCPTFQVDKRQLSNRSVNDALCLSQPRWAEYVIGYITDKTVLSRPLHNLMNGNVLYFRFLMNNENYAETSFSLSGSKAGLNGALGKDLIVTTKHE